MITLTIAGLVILYCIQWMGSMTTTGKLDFLAIIGVFIALYAWAHSN